jgi:hypothetical protein
MNRHHPDIHAPIQNFNELLREGTEVIETIAYAFELAVGDTFTCHRDGAPTEIALVIVTSVEPPRGTTSRIIFQRCANQC